jgi:hypothetical protein
MGGAAEKCMMARRAETVLVTYQQDTDEDAEGEERKRNMTPNTKLLRTSKMPR